MESAPKEVVFRLLGPVEVRRGGLPIEVRAGKHRALLATLLLRANQVVPLEELTDRIWGEHPPARARGTLQTYVMRLRQALGDEPGPDQLVHTRPEGYLIRLTPAQLDLFAFRELLAQGRALAAQDDPAGEADRLRAALALWRGEALTGVPSDALRRDEAPRLAEERLQVLERRIEVDLQLGRHTELAGELQRLTAEHPLRERFWHQLMLALYRCDRQAEALRTFHQVSDTLAEELGIDPGEALRQLHRAILVNDPALAAPCPVDPGAPIAEAPRAGVPRQLPPDLADFVGREPELTQIGELLAGAAPGTAAPIVVLSGPPGIGKTALAVRAAHRLGERFPDGQLHINLRGHATSRPMTVAEALAHFLRVLGVAQKQIPAEIEEQAALYRSLLTGRRMLVVLDNAAAADQVRPLLPAEARCGVLVTSRDDLRGLTALQGARRLTLEVLDRPEARGLLAAILGPERVAAEPLAADALAELCARLPLALRIAAANLVSNPRHTLGGYRDELRAGTIAALSIDGDDQTAVHAAFDLSYTALPADARRLFRHLGLVPGPDFTAQAAAALAGIDLAEADRLLDRLAAANLVGHLSDPAPRTGRFHFHDLLRRYALDLGEEEDSGADLAAARRRLFAAYLAGADHAIRRLYPDALLLPRDTEDVPAPGFDTGPAALAWLDTERANLLAAVHHAADHGPPETAWHLIDSLRLYFYAHRHTAEWLAAGHAALRAAQQHGEVEAAATMHHNIGTAHSNGGDYQQAVEHFQRALSLRAGRPRTVATAKATATTLNNLGIAHAVFGRLTEAADHLLQAVTLHRELGAAALAHSTLVNLSIVLADLGRLRTAAAHLGEALDFYADHGSRYDQANTQEALARVHLDLGEHAEAARHAEAALANARAVDDRRTECDALCTQAALHLAAGEHTAALRAATGSLGLARDIAHAGTEIDALIVLTQAHTAAGAAEEALHCGREAERVARAAGRQVKIGQALTALAAAVLAGGGAGVALATAQQALDLHTETGHRLGEARTLLIIADGLALGADTAAAQSYRQRADALFAELWGRHREPAGVE
ncbi:AfsR/SARP family transcriptional regulator [Crossiella sp. CA198]|uniref:AfsR/SARP family transcriptional regulator n=1 Tax=Crossiella sp. CA198 TaxID=3455607 RepID=UPI003F8CF799